MCWCFSTTSFLESEIYRLTQRKIKLSELHTVYWEYVEKDGKDWFLIKDSGSMAYNNAHSGSFPCYAVAGQRASCLR